jgi:hypothetical protein
MGDGRGIKWRRYIDAGGRLLAKFRQRAGRRSGLFRLCNSCDQD